MTQTNQKEKKSLRQIGIAYGNFFVNGENQGTFLLCIKKLDGVNQLIPDATPPIGKIHPFSKKAVTFEPIMQFSYPLRFRMV